MPRPEPAKTDPGCPGHLRHRWADIGWTELHGRGVLVDTGEFYARWCRRCGAVATKPDGEGERFHVPERGD